jgi:cellulose biosynthesis protein BcsQ
MKSILFFNNKGGVGKTTLACNVVSYLAAEFGKRVLLVDADPQCNATQALLSDEIQESIYSNDDGPAHDTLYKVLHPFHVGEPGIDLDIRPVNARDTRFEVDLLPGHPKMSVIEDRLSDAWRGVKAREIGGFRQTNWCHHVNNHFADNYDIAVYDVGPSLGALNRSVILACDYMVTPFGCDIFSLLGIKNIAEWIKNWNEQYQIAVNGMARQEMRLFDRYSLLASTDDRFRFIGYSVQQYTKRKFKDGARPVKSYDRIMQQIPDTVAEAMDFLTPARLSGEDTRLGDVPYIFSLIPMAQAARAPVFRLQHADGLVGSQNKGVEEFEAVLRSVCEKIIANTDGGGHAD